MKVAIVTTLILAASTVQSVTGFKCYHHACSAEQCDKWTDATLFKSHDQKWTCPDGCTYSTIKDLEGNPIPHQPLKMRGCWEKSQRDWEAKRKPGTCWEVGGIFNNRVDRTCVCDSDWCNDPQQDNVFDQINSAHSIFDLGFKGHFIFGIFTTLFSR